MLNVGAEGLRRPHSVDLAMLRRLWSDEHGAIISGEYIVIGTILTLGLALAWATLRTAVLAQINDQIEAIGLPDDVGPVGPAPDSEQIITAADVMKMQQMQSNAGG